MATSKQAHEGRVQALTTIVQDIVSTHFTDAHLTLADLIGADDAEDERAEQEIRRYFDPI
tara:strand:- start:238 stop:417 length:180 start_codon:yes stop_codon:yes gene_type:complete